MDKSFEWMEEIKHLLVEHLTQLFFVISTSPLDGK